MDIQEIKDLKKECAMSIHKLVIDFEKKTGTEIKEVSLTRSKVYGPGATEFVVQDNIELTIEI